MGEAKRKESQIVLVPFKVGHRLTLLVWLRGRTWKGFDERRRRQRLRDALHLVPDRDYRIRTIESGKDPAGQTLFSTIVEVGRFGPPDGDARPFYRFRQSEGRNHHLFELTLDQVDWLTRELDGYDVDDNSADSLLEIEEALHAAKLAYAQPADPAALQVEGNPTPRWTELGDGSFKLATDQAPNEDEDD